MFDKKTVIDVLLCILFVVILGFEIKIGVALFVKKCETDTGKIIEQSALFGQNVGLITDVFSWPDAPEPNADGDVISINGNRYKINGKVASILNDYNGTVYYSDLEDSSSRQLQYTEVVDANVVYHFQQSLLGYFEGDTDEIVNFLSTDTTMDDIECYQQNHVDGVIPVLYDMLQEKYIMLLDCDSSFYILKCSDPFIVSNDAATVHYSKAADDPLNEHVWSKYELGAIDNTRWNLANGVQLDPYTGTSSDNQSGSSVSESTEVSNNMYRTQADDTARANMVGYASKTFDETGAASDGSTHVDISSVAAKASEWVLTETQYTYTDNGITINGLSGRRTSSIFEISGSASNMLSAERPWVLVVKFMDSDKLLGLRVIDNRTTPIATDGVASFKVELSPEDGIDFSKITAVQFEVR